MRVYLPLFVLCLNLAAQTKRPLTIADYDSWRAISGQKLTDDGKWLVYALMPQARDGEVVARELATGKEYRVPVGLQPPPASDGEGEGPPPPRGPRIAISSDGRYVVTQTFGKKNGMAVLALADGAVARMESIKSFAVAETGAPVVAYLEDGEAKRLGVRVLGGGASAVYEGVTEMALSRDGATLAAATADEVFAVAVGGGARTVLKSGKGKYAKLTFDADGKQLAFLADGVAYGWRLGEGAAEEWAKAPAGQVVSERGPFTFTKNGAALVFSFGAKPQARKTADGSKAVYELWHWRDERIQTIQKARAATERGQQRPALFRVAEKKLVMLGDDAIREATVSDDANTALGVSEGKYGRLADFDARYRDIWTLDAHTGERRLAVEKTLATPVLSPDGKWAVYFAEKAWRALDMKSGKTASLTGKIPVSFADEQYDMTGSANSYGAAGWTKDSGWYIVYDRYDVWALRPDGSETKNVTEGLGRRERMALRVTRPRVDPRDRGIDGAQPLLLSAEREANKESGFYRDWLHGAAEPARLLMAAKKFGALMMAKSADVAVLTAQRFDEFPDLLVTDSTFASLRKVSDANPQKKEMQWGTAELVDFRNTDGVALQGILYKPENFDATRKYPLLVYIYERLSGGLHTFVEPSPSHRVNASLYASNGYLVLMPDIVYTAGYPGESAMKCVLAAVQRVVDMGIVDEKRIGIQGHSWGGYQIAYMVTRTNRFAAAAPGALVANMTSAYDGIRYGAGVPRQFQYERGQSRIGGSLWEYPMRYLDNSPLFRVDQIQTPLLMLHNDRDDAVPFTQGIEFYLALRRLNKEVYFFNYNGEPHGLRKRANQRDYATRMLEFFGHFLQGAPKPEWMETVVPYSERKQ